MAKVMLVEDDNNLREIYEARLAAEGYEIVSAADGEAALALAIKEKPDLIISDIMMPKVSGFDMLDILKSTTETKNCKIIMMTALNQAEDKAKAEKLGADVYLVKSQVTLEDVVRSAKTLLGEENPLSVGGVAVQQPLPPANQAISNSSSLTGNAPTVPNQSVAAVPASPAQTVPVSTPAPAVTPTPVEVQAPAPVPTADGAPVASSTAQEEAALQKQIEQYIIEDNPTITTSPDLSPPTSSPTAPASSPQLTNVAPAPASPAQTVPVSTPAPAVTPTPVEVQAPAPSPQLTPTPGPAPQPQSSFAQPPSSMAANTPASDGDVTEDRPAGEQIIVKSAPANSSEPGIDASISGRKKVIRPISDVLTSGPNLDALLAKEGEAPTTAPTLNTVVTPDGMTMSTATGTPTMTDVVAPNPNAAKEPTPQQPLPPPVA